MPKTLCCVPRCSNRGGHGFPANEMLKQQWIVAIKRVREDGKKWHPTATSVVCYRHFLPEDYTAVTYHGKRSATRLHISTDQSNVVLLLLVIYHNVVLFLLKLFTTQ